MLSPKFLDLIFLIRYQRFPPLWTIVTNTLSPLLTGSKPEWKKLSGLPYTLSETSCTVLLESTCSVKLEIDDKIVEAKRIQVYAAGRYLHAWDSFAEMEVGYYPDLPGGSEVCII